MLKPNCIAMKLSRSSVYALAAVLELARGPRDIPVSSATLAKRSNLPARFLPQLLRKLVRQRVLCSTVGVTGGYSLARCTSQITLLEIIEPFEVTRTQELHLIPISADARNTLALVLDTANAAARRQLNGCIIADLVNTQISWPSSIASTTMSLQCDLAEQLKCSRCFQVAW